MTGYFIGAVLCMGVVLCIDALRRPAPLLKNRILPYASDGWRKKNTALRYRVTKKIVAFLEKFTSSNDEVRQRLYALGDVSIKAFRMRQLMWTVGGLFFDVLLALSVSLRGATVIVGVLMPALGALSGALACDYLLKQNIQKRSNIITQELPDIAELLALAVSAGEPVRNALERIVAVGTGELPKEFKRTLDYVHSGMPLDTALRDLAVRCANPALERFAHALISSLERGTSLSEVLREQANDAREYARRQLLEKGGKQEIRMMIPVIFIIMPITVLFTLYPGIRTLTFIP